MIGERQWDRAENYLVKSYRRNPYQEDTTGLLLELYMETGNRSKAVKHFNAYSDLVKEELGIEPPGRLQEIVKSKE